MSRGSTAGPGAAVPSLTSTTIRRAISIGWLYLAIGSFQTLLLTSVLVLAAPKEFAVLFPFLIPLFASVGAMGGLMTFSSDRTKGVLEYLISYGVPPQALVNNGLLSTVVLAAIILALGLGVGLGAATIHGVPLTQDLWKLLAFYTTPMCFANALFTVAVGMIWSSLATPRAGMNSPVGIAPMIGIAPTFLVLLAALAVPSSYAPYVIYGAPEAVIAAVVGLLLMSARFMRRERFLSPL